MKKRSCLRVHLFTYRKISRFVGSIEQEVNKVWLIQQLKCQNKVNKNLFSIIYNSNTLEEERGSHFNFTDFLRNERTNMTDQLLI